MQRLLAPLLVLLAPLTARAGYDSIVTAAVGSHTVVGRSAGRDEGAGMSMGGGQGVGLRVRALYFLGADLSCDLTSDWTRADLAVAPPRFKLSALIYIVPKDRYSLYLIAGLGATDARDLFSIDGATTSYHAGAGLEIAFSRHWVLSAEWRTLLPAWAHVEARRGDRSLWAFYNFDTWQVGLGLRYYL